MLTQRDRAWQAQGQRARADWERGLRAAVAVPADMASAPAAGIAAPAMPALPDLRRVAQVLRAELAAAIALGGQLIRHAAVFPWRRAILAGSSVAAAGIFLALIAITKGYLDHPPEFWEARIAERMQSPIYDRDKTLVGSIGHGALDADSARDYAFIPLQGALPATYRMGLLRMENRHYLAGGWHNVCGLDLPSTAARWLTLAGAGGSTLSMQLARELKRPAWGNERGLLQKAWRKGQEIGASCRLYRMLETRGGAEEILRLYAAYAPAFQGNGTLRGIEAASRIVFDRAPARLSDAQQLVLAAAVRKPLALLPPGGDTTDCGLLYPRRANPDFDAEATRRHPARAVQCQVLQRALWHADAVLEGPRLRQATAELQAYRRRGIHPANPFQAIPARRLVNLASRTAATMSPGLVAAIRDEAEAADGAPGQPLRIVLDAQNETAFAGGMRNALAEAQGQPATRRLLCQPLLGRGGDVPAVGACPGATVTADAAHADVLAIKADVRSGDLRAMYATSPELLDGRYSIGSTAKWIIVVAALAHGHAPDGLLCPRTAYQGARRLRRVTRPEEGYADCAQGQHLVSLERATAESDNLAFYALARALPPGALAAAARATGLGHAATDDAALALALSFGTYGASPRELLAAGQALVGLAYGIPQSGQAPRILQAGSVSQRSAAPASAQALARLLPHEQQRADLRRLLEAPVALRGGTLHAWRGQIAAGKTGTVQSAVHVPGGRPYLHAKWSISYQPQKRALNLLLVTSPSIHLPLARPELGHRALAPAQRLILAAD